MSSEDCALECQEKLAVLGTASGSNPDAPTGSGLVILQNQVDTWFTVGRYSESQHAHVLQKFLSNLDAVLTSRPTRANLDNWMLEKLKRALWNIEHNKRLNHKGIAALNNLFLIKHE